MTSNFVLDETYTLLLHRAGHHVAVELGEEISASRLLKIVHISPDLEKEAWQLFKRHADKKFSFTDRTPFTVMRQQGLHEAFTNDHNFEQAGFHRLLI